MRGALAPADLDPDVFGIIPADAGITTIRAANANYDRDHPRGCGEHMVDVLSSMFNQGSSPRMRGARTGLSPDALQARIIPADAGSTG